MRSVRTKKLCADAVIVWCVLALLGDSILQPGKIANQYAHHDVSGALGTLTGLITVTLGIFFGTRWHLKLNGHAHKPGRQATATVLFWYAVVAASITFAVAVELVVSRDRSFIVGIVMLVLWFALGYVCRRWLRSLRIQEAGREPRESRALVPENPNV